MKKTALITGASGGLGKDFAYKFAEEGYNLVLVARSEDKLRELERELESVYEIEAKVFAKDLSLKDAAKDVFDYTQANNIQVDLLINNAGFGDFGKFAASDWDRQYKMVQLNISALMQLTYSYLQPMLERGYGKILNLASVAAFQPGPLMSIYYASKAFVLSFTEALSVELQGSGVSVSVLCPGPVETNFIQSAGLEDSGLFKNLAVAQSKDVVDYAYKKLEKNRVVTVPGFLNKLVIFAVRLAPRKLVRKTVLLLQK